MTGITSRIKITVIPNLINTTYSGNREKSIVSTMMFNVGELIMAATEVSTRAPAEYNPVAIGAAQFTQTPNGAPIVIPKRLFENPVLKLRLLW